MSSQKEERRYDNVRIVNSIDGTVIQGHDAVKMHMEREQKLQAEHGASIIFQVYRLNLQADTLEELQGKKLAEIKVDGRFFTSSTATVAVAKEKVRHLLMEKAGKGPNNGHAPIVIEEDDRLTFYLSGRPMQDQTSFYDENYILLPAWIQVLVHRCDSEEAVQLINKLQKKR